MDLSSSSLVLCILLVFYPCQGAAYIEKFFENDNICSGNLEVNEFNLIGSEDQSALIVKDNHHFQPLIGEQEFNCRFTVSTSFGLGIFVVVQRMVFRKNAQGECIDYIQFRRTEKTRVFSALNLKSKAVDPWGSKMCEKINNELKFTIDDSKYNSSRVEDVDDNNAATNSFIFKKGIIEVKIHLGNRSITEDEPSLEVVFTAFQNCKNDMGIWKSCGSGTCIHKNLFHDGKLNCPYKSCKDESGCRPAVISDNGSGKHVFGIKVLAGIVAGVSIILVVFIVIIRLLNYYGTTFFCKGQSNNSELFEMNSSFLDNRTLRATAPPESDVLSYTFRDDNC